MLCISNKNRKRERLLLLNSEMVPGDIPDEAIMGTVRDLHEFLQEAELDHYYNAIKNELKIATIPQLKYVEEDDLNSIGMTKPEMRRLKKFYKKECPQGKLHKLKQAILTKTHLDGSSRSLSPSPPEHRTRPQSYIRHPGKQIISLSSIHVSKSLGEGEFGVVQQGVWTTEDGEKVQVAIKCLSKEKMHTGTSEFLKEAGLMQSIEHENIARMYGVVLDKDNALMLVTELASMRSLLECLKETSLRPDFPIPRLCDFAQQICDGMSYLESKRLIHRDLAARNILVFSKTKVKISDFGLSRALGVGKDYYQSNFSVNLKLPIAWCAPECINYLKFTSASDVWAYAVTVWEMFTYGFQPWAGMTGQQILDAIDIPKCQRLEKPDLCSREYYKLMLSCWDQEPEKRPTFSEIFIRLPQMRPTQVKAVKDFPEITVPKDYLYYKAYDIIIVLDKTPNNPPRSGLWTGATINGKNGYFDPTNVVPFIEPKSSPVSPPPKPSISRKDSKRISSRKLRADMISRPQNDLRHTGHIGYDGAVFGDVSFIGDNYDKLPLKVMSTGRLNESGRVSSSIIHSNDSPERDQTDNVFSNSLSDLRMNGAHKTNGFSRSWISQESLDSTSLLHAESEGTHDGQYQDIDDDSLLSDFKMPDISSSFDFGPSFMDEVLKALNEKEAAFESSQNKASSSSPKDNPSRTSPDRNLSISPPKDMKFPPPPVPVPSPRAADSCDMKQEPRKQAKVKPMSASEEKMIDDAMALANELDRQNSMSQMVNDKQGSPSSPTSDKVSDSESGSESPKLLSKIKMSIKRSPKIERKRTFSEEMATRSDLDESVPPEAQEAYNMLVVHGSAKEVSKNRQRPNDNVQNHIEGSQRDSVGSGLGFNYFERSSNASSSSQTPDRNSQSPERRTPDRSSPVKNISRSSSERSSVSPPSNIGRNSSEKEVTPDRKIDRPVPRPRLEAKRSEIPVPKPRPEINRVEPTPRQPPPPIPEKVKRVQETTEEKKSFLDTALVINEDDFKLSEESVSDKKQIEILRVDLPNSNEDNLNASSSGIEFDWSDNAQETNKDASQKSGTFDEEFSEPSPREIMSKLARESRLRRSIEHQRGIVGEGDAAPNRNLRAPQGIPGKSFSTSGSLGDDDDEVDTNPLRMLRGGAIPIRGGRGGSGKRMVRK
ncbi:hypothetical protein ACJMK2_008522 [Sinanodonta woodiana]|uniref:non-specific protein-tyrosine kinase n=1 Tax=Sinanodonta woodiana TaxID=1069815 RepID=A0ABD3VLW2_SINWO